MDYQVTWTPCNADLAKYLNPFIRDIEYVESITYRHSVMYGGPYVENCYDTVSISGPNLVDVVPSEEFQTGDWRYFGTVEIYQCTFLETISFPLLTRCGYFNINTNPSLTSIDFSSLQVVERNSAPDNWSTELQVSFCNTLTAISFPAFVEVDSQYGGIFINNNTSLSSVNFPSLLPRNGTTVNFRSNALNQSSVDHILARCVANAAYVSGVVNLSGGTNAAPSAAGLLDKATLIGRGVTVTTN